MGCNCSSLACCPDKQYVQDKVCNPWSGTGAVDAVDVVVYSNNLNQTIFGTGYLRYDTGDGEVTVQVFDGDPATATPFATAELLPGQSFSFTYRRFTTIQVEIPAAAEGLFQGEFCITTRYAVT